VKLVWLVLAAAVVWVLVPETGSAASTPAPACNGGGCGGWFRSNVTVTWSYDPAGVTSAPGCGATTITDDTAGATVTCTVYAGTAFFGNSVSVAKDSSPPSVDATISRSPDADGWYTSPVSVSFSGDGGPSGISSCSGGGTYSGPDGNAVQLSGTCTDGAGNSASSSLTIKYDATPPTVTPTPERPPDVDGWYNHPVKVAFAGQDGGAGVTECTAPVTYAGPDGNPAKLVGQCRDGVGHLSAPATMEIRYDGTKPTRPTVSATRTSGAVTLAWKTSPDAVRAEVVRSPGKTGKKPGVVFAGKGARVVDKSAKGTARYWYEVRVYDQAGNVASRTLPVRPSTGILAPATGAVLRRAPLVQWAPVKKARFYNVQLWRKREKLLTIWPAVPRLRLHETWTFAGRRLRLEDGSYQLYVWPAFGTQSSPRYGKLVGKVKFVVKR
jgi:hypothetical protein